MTLYSQQINGVICYSNIPFDESPTSSTPGTTWHYVHEINFANQISEELLAGYSESNFKNELYKQYNGQITNYKAVQTGPTQITIEYDASSPPVLIVIAVIFAIAAIITYMITNTVTTVTKNMSPAQVSSVFGDITTIAAIGLAGVLIVLGLYIAHRLGYI